MSTADAVERWLKRIRALEQRQSFAAPATLPAPSAAEMRVILATLLEAGAFINPRPDGPLWLFREHLKSELGWSDDDFRLMKGANRE
ncbi:MAG TPA: hypothetical protein VF808_14440 [Ktedonobacterales bacterium]